MARLTTPPSFTGTKGAVTVYRMFGRYYIRSKSSLTAKRVKKDPAFHKTMEYAALLARASRLASEVYALLPARRKKLRLYRKLTGEAMTWLKYEWKEEDIKAYLLKQFGGKQLPVEGETTKLRPTYCRSSSCLRLGTKCLMKHTPREPVSIELREWRRRDKLFRKMDKQMLSSPEKTLQHTSYWKRPTTGHSTNYKLIPSFLP